MTFIYKETNSALSMYNDEVHPLISDWEITPYWVRNGFVLVSQYGAAVYFYYSYNPADDAGDTEFEVQVTVYDDGGAIVWSGVEPTNARSSTQLWALISELFTDLHWDAGITMGSTHHHHPDLFRYVADLYEGDWEKAMNVQTAIDGEEIVLYINDEGQNLTLTRKPNGRVFALLQDRDDKTLSNEQVQVGIFVAQGELKEVIQGVEEAFLAKHLLQGTGLKDYVNHYKQLLDSGAPIGKVADAAEEIAQYLLNTAVSDVAAVLMRQVVLKPFEPLDEFQRGGNDLRGEPPYDPVPKVDGDTEVMRREWRERVMERDQSDWVTKLVLYHITQGGFKKILAGKWSDLKYRAQAYMVNAVHNSNPDREPASDLVNEIVEHANWVRIEQVLRDYWEKDDIVWIRASVFVILQGGTWYESDNFDIPWAAHMGHWENNPEAITDLVVERMKLPEDDRVSKFSLYHAEEITEDQVGEHDPDEYEGDD